MVSFALGALEVLAVSPATRLEECLGDGVFHRRAVGQNLGSIWLLGADIS